MRTIDSARLRLRELEIADVTQTYVDWLNDDTINRYLETRFHKQDGDAVRGFVETVRGRDNEFLFGIFLLSDARHIGNIKIGPINPHHRVGDISLFIGDRDSWGRGYATEAIVALSEHAFSTLAMRKVSAGIYAPNTGSIRAFIKSGYRQEGMRRNHYTLNGEPCDLIEFGLFPSDLVR